jgi:hypothetical protein
MSILVPFESRYLTNLHEMVTQEITRQVEMMISGNLIIRSDAAAPGRAYVGAVENIKGLKATLGYMANVHQDMTGKVKRKKDED